MKRRAQPCLPFSVGASSSDTKAGRALNFPDAVVADDSDEMPQRVGSR